MSTEQMREEFEAWFASSGMTKFKETAWTSWQASRAALVVELPPTITVDGAAEVADLEDERAANVAHMVNGAIAACGAFIKAAGVRVKE